MPAVTPTPSALERFSPVARAWFRDTFAAPTKAQELGWAAISRGAHTLLLAPTGSGKTLAAFLSALDRLATTPPPLAPPARGRRPRAGQRPRRAGVRVLYISPLKALSYDVERNLRSPLAGLRVAAAREGLPPLDIEVAIRTGDTPNREREDIRRDPPDILITTPESLYLMLTSRARDVLRTVDTVIVDEIHTMAGTKRGAHLALSLERLECLVEKPFQRIGLSATQRPLDEIARYLGGARTVEIADAGATKELDLQVIIPVEDMARPGDNAIVHGATPDGREIEAASSIWPAIYPKLLELVRAHRSTLIFVNNRRLSERIAARVNELAGEELLRAHHGSVSREQRTDIEERLKAGMLPGIVCTSSMELGIDMGAVDLVIQVESPKSVARGLQRVGRAGHQVDAPSVGRIFPKFRGDLLECAVLVERMHKGLIERTDVPKNPLDVLAQQIVAMCAVDDWTIDALHEMVRRTWNFAGLSREALESVLGMLAGQYPSDEFADLRPRLLWDRDTDVLSSRRDAKTIAVVNAGTIPDRGLYGVFLGLGGPRVGELDEEMVYESRPGETFILGATTWRIDQITRDQVIVSPAHGEPGKMPFWRGDGVGRPLEFGRAIGAFTRKLDAIRAPEQAERLLQSEHALDELASRNLLAYLAEEKEATGALPTDKTVVVERFRDELGDWRVVILTPFGGRVHAPWAQAIEGILADRSGFDVQTIWSDDGIAIRFAGGDELPRDEVLFPSPDEVEEIVVGRLADTPLFASHFRENAARALLLPRRRPGSRTPLWMQRQRSANLLAVASRYGSFPIILETYRECLREVFDMPGLIEILGQVRSREVRVHSVETAEASPFARSLLFDYISAYMYEGDAPLAERRAQALTLDRTLLRDLLGQDELRELLDPAALEQLELELQCLVEGRKARNPDQLHDLLRRLGDLTLEEVEARIARPSGSSTTDTPPSAADPTPRQNRDRHGADGPTATGAPPSTTDATGNFAPGTANFPQATTWLTQLETEHRACRVRIAAEERWIPIEDAGRYRDALGVSTPLGVPEVFLKRSEAPLEGLLGRYARTHAPFLPSAPAARWSVPERLVVDALQALEQRGAVLHGEFRPGGQEREWCDPDVLRSLRRMSLARLRREVEPVPPEAYARFLARWQGLGSTREGLNRLRDAATQLEGLPLPASILEREILGARVADYQPRLLDELGTGGEIAWVGCGPLGKDDGRVALYRRDRVPAPPTPESDAEWEPVQLAILRQLREGGASFFGELVRAAAVHPRDTLDALWDLVWAGLVTNDAFGALRALAWPKRDTAGHHPPRTGSLIPPEAAGRWSLVRAGQTETEPRPPGSGASHGDQSSLAANPRILTPTAREGARAAPTTSAPHQLPRSPLAATSTARAHTLATQLLERYGVVTREGVAAEGLPGGFSAVYPVLKAMEEAGRVRRGYFVEGLGASQFALPGAVERLRAEREAPEEPSVHLISALDPANPYGASVPWPQREGDGRRALARAAGARVVLVDGEPVLYLERGGRGLVTLPAFDRPALAELAIAALLPAAAEGRPVTIERIDGEPANASPHAATFLEAGFVHAYRGLSYRQPVPRRPVLAGG